MEIQFTTFIPEVVTLPTSSGKLTGFLEGLIPSGEQIKKSPTINAISDTFEDQWNFVLFMEFRNWSGCY